MAIMTKDQFKTLSSKWFSKRNGTIAEIDGLLDDYHHGLTHGWPVNEDELDAVTKLRAVVDKFQREKEEKYLNRDWHARKEQSSKRRIAVETLRDQVYERMWELYHPKRDDLSLYESSSADEDETQAEKLATELKKLRIRIKGTAKKSNRLRSKLHGDVEAWLKNEGKTVWEDSRKKHVQAKTETAAETAMRNAWFYYYKDSGEPADIIRLGTVDWEDLVRNDHCTYLKYADSSTWDATEKLALGKMGGQGDAQVGIRACKHPPIEKFPAELRTEFAEYLADLLGNEMAEESLFVQEVLKGDKYYRAVVHLDYYAFRSLTNIGLHKDTVGNTLFVALHYINDGPMMGPEYVDDPAPICPMGGPDNGFYPHGFYMRNAGPNQRQGAPWAKVRKVKGETKFVWPKDLLDALQAARNPPDKSDYIQGFDELPANGLVSFVDELVFHATPNMNVREALDFTDTQQDKTEKRRYMSSGVSVPGVGGLGGEAPKLNVFGERTYQTRIKRRLSIALDNGEKLAPATSGSEDDPIRRFWRVWLSVVPKHWYEELVINDH